MLSHLPSQYDLVVKQYKELEETGLSSTDLRYVELVKKTLELLLEIQHKVHALSMFSINETLEDINTADLKYMKLLGWIGLVYLKLYDPETRKATLLESKKYMVLFLEFLELYGFDVSNSKPSRETKIQDFRKRKELNNEMETLVIGDEEQCRKLYILELELLILDVRQEYWNVEMEMEMILYKEKLEEDERMKRSHGSEERVETRNVRQERPKALLSKEGKVLQPFVITTERVKREELQSGVFRPGHSLPTMTIEEYLQREVERGNVLSGGT
jgi:hypothetical protein